jgi:hypothetical protein
LPALARQGLIGGTPGVALSHLRDGTSLAMIVDAVTFFSAVAALLFLFIPSPQRSDLRASGRLQHSIWADVREGALYIWNRRPLLWLLGTFTIANFAGSPEQVFQPLLVKFNLAADWSAHGFAFATALALLGTSASLGGVAGGFSISAWGGLKAKRVYGVVVPMIVGGLAQIVFGLSSLLYLSVAMAFIGAGMVPILNAHSQAIWQTQTPRELQGRVFSVRRVIAQFTNPISVAVLGVLGGLFNPGYVIALLGVILAVFCVLQLFNPALRRVEDHVYVESLAVGKSTGRSE